MRRPARRGHQVPWSRRHRLSRYGRLESIPQLWMTELRDLPGPPVLNELVPSDPFLPAPGGGAGGVPSRWVWVPVGVVIWTAVRARFPGHQATNHPCAIVARTALPSVSCRVAAVTSEPA